MIEAQAIDIGGLQTLIGGLQNALIGTGHNGDATQICAQQSRLLIEEIVHEIAPKSLEKGVAAAKRMVRSHFLPGPEVAFEQSKRGGALGITWLYAGPDFLAGTKNEDLRPELDLKSSLEFMRGEERRSGNAWVNLGEKTVKGFFSSEKIKTKRGKQNVMLMNRTVIKRQVFFKLLEEATLSIGRMKASWAATAQELASRFGKGKMFRNWIMRHLPSPKAITNLGGLDNAQSPSAEFGSRSRGITNFEPQIKKAVETRKRKVAEGLKRVLNGYAYDANSGNRIRSHAHDVSEN